MHNSSKSLVKFKLPDCDVLHRLFSYDPESGVLIAKTTTHRWKAGRVAGYTNGKNGNRFYVGIGGVQYSAHRIIWKMMTGSDPEAEIDHIDLDGKNNRWSNLRSATRTQNDINRRGWASSGLKGAYPHHAGGWYSKIIVNKKHVYLGKFDNPNAAHAAYAAKALEVFGEFARVM